MVNRIVLYLRYIWACSVGKQTWYSEDGRMRFTLHPHGLQISIRLIEFNVVDPITGHLFTKDCEFSYSLMGLPAEILDSPESSHRSAEELARRKWYG